MHSTNTFGESRYATETPDQKSQRGNRANGSTAALWPSRGRAPKFAPMNHLFQFLIPIALGAVLITLCVGIFALFKGGDFGRSYSNKLMRLRVALQFLAVIVLMTAVWWKNH
jgi:hypothetical protein